MIGTEIELVTRIWSDRATSVVAYSRVLPGKHLPTRNFESETTVRQYTLPIVIEKDLDGYVAVCPSLQGCCTEGDTYEEIMENLCDAIQLHLQDRIARGEAIDTAQTMSITTVEVAA